MVMGDNDGVGRETGPPRVTKSYRTAGDAQVHLRSCGEDGPGVLLLHHAPSSSATWDTLLPHLAGAGLRAVAVDLPGYGGSDRPSRQPDLGWYADQVAAVLGGLGGSWTVVGRQTGAEVAAALAVRHPHLVGGLVLWGYPLFGPDLMTQLATEVTDDLDDELTSPRAFLADLRRHDPLAGHDSYDRATLAEYLSAGRHQHWAHNAVGRSDAEALLRRVRQPTVLVYDMSRTDLPGQLAAARAAALVLPAAPLVDMPGVASSLAPTATPAFADLVARFAASPETFDPDGENDRP